VIVYTLAVRRDFIARHFLIGGDWGPENLPNSHHYLLELQLSGPVLDQHGYLVDLVEVERLLDRTLARYRDQLLNDLPEFAGLNPSLEHFARILCTTLNDHLPALNLSTVRVVLWENPNAWAAYQIERPLSG